MNVQDESRFPADDRSIDLLVDGELDDTRRRELLGRLDALPGGWRRCALAFLEAQSWQREMRSIARGADAPAAKADAAPRRSVQFWFGSWSNLFALAASFLMAFGLGVWYRSDDSASLPGGGNSANLAGMPIPSLGSLNQGSLPIDESSVDEGYVTLFVDGVAEGESNSVRLPLQVVTDDPRQALAANSFELPPEVVAELRAVGRTVRQERRYVPVQLHDGRQLVVPVDEVRVVPVSRAFQ